MRLVGDLLERFAADEVVVELDERAVAELVRRQVVVLDVVGDEAAADRAGGLVARRRQPLAVLLHLLAGVDRGQRRGNPARLERVARVGARADLDQAEVPARLDDRLADLVALCVRTPDLEPGRTGHAVPQGADLAALDVDRVHVEELDVRERAAVQPLEDLRRVRALDLVAVVPPHDGVAARLRRRAVVADDLDLVAAGLGVELQPVHGRHAPDEQQLVLVEIEQNAVADDVAVVAARHHLLGLVRLEIGEAVDGRVRDQLERIRSLDGELRHVMRLVEQHRGLAPGALLVAPVGEFVGDDRVDIRADLASCAAA